MISWHHLVAWRKLENRVKVVAICDPDVDRAKRRADEFGIAEVHREAEAMLSTEGIDAIDIASPPETHAAWIEAAAARGIDVLCQKPLTPTLSEAECVLSRVENKHRIMVHENWRFRPWYRELRHWITVGELGDITYARLALINSGFLPDAHGVEPAFARQPYLPHEPRLIIADVLIHHLDVMRFLCGDLRVVAARGRRTLTDVTGETAAAIFLENSTGAPVEVVGVMAAPGYPPRVSDRLELIGTKASVAFENGDLRLLGARPRRETYVEERGYQLSFDAAIEHFVDCLESGASFETGPRDNLESLRLAEHAYWAAGLGCPR